MLALILPTPCTCYPFSEILKQLVCNRGLSFIKALHTQKTDFVILKNCVRNGWDWRWRTYLWWSLCTLYLLAHQVSYPRHFRSLLCLCAVLHVLINSLCLVMFMDPMLQFWCLFLQTGCWHLWHNGGGYWLCTGGSAVVPGLRSRQTSCLCGRRQRLWVLWHGNWDHC